MARAVVKLGCLLAILLAATSSALSQSPFKAEPPAIANASIFSLAQAGGKWLPLASLHGRGATICNTSGDLYSCFALRCGKGRGLEFAFIFNVGTYGSFPAAEVSVDGVHVDQVVFTALDMNAELVAAYDPQRHAGLIRRLRAGRTLTLDLGFKHLFTLNGSSREINRTLRICGSADTAPTVAQRQDKSQVSEAPLNNRILRVTKLFQRKYGTNQGASGNAERTLSAALKKVDTDPAEARRLFANAITQLDTRRLNEESVFFSDEVKQALAGLSMKQEVEYLAVLEARAVTDYYRQGESTASLAFVGSFAFELEKLKLYGLADDYYAAITAIREGAAASRSDMLGRMLLFASEMVEVGSFELSRKLSRRVLRYARESGDLASQIEALTLLGTVASEAGDLEASGKHAQTALRLVKKSGVELEPWQQEKLDNLLLDSLVVAGDSGSALDGFRRSLAKSHGEYCAREDAYTFEHVDLSIFDGDKALTRAAARLSEFQSYPQCYRRKLDAVRSGKLNSISSNMLRETMFYLGAVGDKADAQAFLKEALDPAIYGAPDPEQFDNEYFAQAIGHAYDGLVLAGVGEWMADQAPFFGRYFDRARLDFIEESIFSGEFGPMGMMFLELGETDAALRIVKALEAAEESYVAQYDWLETQSCRTSGGCAFLATMADRGLIAGDPENYLQHLPEAFRSEHSGAGTSAGEARFLHTFAIDQVDYFADRNSLKVAGKFLEIANQWAATDIGKEDALSSMDALNILSLSARIEAAKGNREEANRIAGRILTSMQDKISVSATFGPDLLLRWSDKLGAALDTYLETLAFDGEGRAQVDGDVLTAMAFAQASGTASTFIKLSARMGLQSGELGRRHQKLGAELDQAYATLATLEAGAAQKLIATITNLENDRQKVSGELAKEAPEYFQIARLHFPTLAQIRAFMDADEAMLATYTTDQLAYTLWIEKDTAEIRKLADTTPALAGKIERFRYAMDTNDSYRAVPLDLANELFEILFPRGVKVFERINKIVFAPHGPFDGLSLPALVVSPSTKPTLEPRDLRKLDIEWFARRASVAVLPSIGAIGMARNAETRDTQRFFGVGNPDYQNAVNLDGPRAGGSNKIPIPPLPDTEDEIRTIAALYGADEARDLLLGEAATENNIKSTDLSDYDVLSFAVHGVFAGEVEGFDEPALVLSIPEDASGANDGLLKASEVTELRLNAEMVILSACNTAAPSGKPGAEGLSGLARSFFFAGARNLAVTHWYVPSEATVSLVTGMVKRKKADPDLSWSEALRRSQLALIDATGPDLFAHPASWGAFFIVGVEKQR